MKVGDKIVVTLSTGPVIEGTIRFTNESLISVDQGGGIAALVKFDPGAGQWRLGKIPVGIDVYDKASVAFTEAQESFGARLNKAAKRARSKPGAPEL